MNNSSSNRFNPSQSNMKKTSGSNKNTADNDFGGGNIIILRINLFENLFIIISHNG